MKHLSVILLITLLSGSCTKHGPFRPQYPPYLPVLLPATELSHRVIEDHGRYKLAFIEFDDHGNRLEGKKQIEAAVDHLRAARHLHPITGAVQDDTIGGLTVMYVHGWKNDAQSRPDKPKDVEKFRAYMADLVKDLAVPDTLPVTGVFFGWRGRSVDIDNDLLNFWTVWPRHWAAKTVATGPDAAPSIAQVIDAAIAGRDKLGVNQRPRFILIGHSFGARVLEESIEKVHSTESDDPQYGAILGQCVALKAHPVGSLIDLTLLVNEATKSYTVRRANKVCQPDPATDRYVRNPGFSAARCPNGIASPDPVCQPYPLFVHLATKAVWVTRFLLPAALFGRTAPHTASLRTHNIDEFKGPTPTNAVFTYESGAKTFAVTPRLPGSRHPIWIMRGDQNLMKSHGDIFNPTMNRYIKSLIGGLEIIPLKTYNRATKRTQ